MDNSPSAPRLTTGVKMLYGIGAMAYTAKNALLGLLLLFYNQLVGLPSQWVSLALSLSLVVDALWDPLVGYASDNLRSRFGRRHPFMFLAAVPFALCWVLLWQPPEGWSQSAIFVRFLCLIIACRMAASLFEVPASALVPELAPTYDGRTDLFSYRCIFGALGGVGASALAYGVFLRGQPGHPMGQLNRAAYGPYSICIALIMVAAMMSATLGTLPWIRSLHRPDSRKHSFFTTVKLMTATLMNRNFATILVSGVFSGISMGVGTGLSIYLNTYFWELPSSKLLMLALPGLISAPAAAFVTPWLSRKWGKRRLAMRLMAAALVLTVAPVGLRLLGVMPPNGSSLLIVILVGGQLFEVFCTAGAVILMASMLADVVEESELSTGRRSEGLLMSAGFTLQKVLGGFAAIVPGIILAVVGFPRHAVPGAVAPQVLRHLALLYLPAMATMSVLAIFCLAFYRIDRAGHESFVRAIGLRKGSDTSGGDTVARLTNDVPLEAPALVQSAALSERS